VQAAVVASRYASGDDFRRVGADPLVHEVLRGGRLAFGELVEEPALGPLGPERPLGPGLVGLVHDRNLHGDALHPHHDRATLGRR
jgi:hypothetical protein